MSYHTKRMNEIPLPVTKNFVSAPIRLRVFFNRDRTNPICYAPETMLSSPSKVLGRLVCDHMRVFANEDNSYG